MCMMGNKFWSILTNRNFTCLPMVDCLTALSCLLIRRIGCVTVPTALLIHVN